MLCTIAVACFVLYFGRDFGIPGRCSTCIKILLLTGYSTVFFMSFYVLTLIHNLLCKLQIECVTDIGFVTPSHMALHSVMLSGHCPPPVGSQAVERGALGNPAANTSSSNISE